MYRDLRLTGRKHFAAVYSRGRILSNRLLVLRVLPKGSDRSRVAVAAGRRIGKAVVRNKIKRRLREVVRLAGVRPGWSVVLIARRDSHRADFWALKAAVEQLFNRAGLLLSTPNTVRRDL